ncbi:MAG: hypothetical protein EOM91_21880 [Sphingobacteriia bacterium]|nr:hypothetical protein [Sphingobacteriia bacterium]
MQTEKPRALRKWPQITSTLGANHMDFYRDFFTREQLLVSLEQAQFVPNMLSSAFETLGNVTSTNVDIEILGKDAAALKAAIPRGGPAPQSTLDKDGVEVFKTSTYADEIPILADSVLNARQRGSVNPAVINDRRNRAVAKLRRWADLQHEYLRVSVLNTPNNVFGNAPAEVVVGFGAADSGTRAAIHTGIIKPLETALDGLAYTGIDAYCSDAYWLGLIESKTIRETYLNWAAAAEMRSQSADMFVYGGVTWHRYREQGSVAITAGKAKVIPRGVSGLMVQAFAPDDTLSSVGMGETGQPYYLNAWPIDDDKGYRIKIQTHPVMVCTRPTCVLTLKLS